MKQLRIRLRSSQKQIAPSLIDPISPSLDHEQPTNFGSFSSAEFWLPENQRVSSISCPHSGIRTAGL